MIHLSSRERRKHKCAVYGYLKRNRNDARTRLSRRCMAYAVKRHYRDLETFNFLINCAPHVPPECVEYFRDRLAFTGDFERMQQYERFIMTRVLNGTSKGFGPNLYGGNYENS